VPAKIEIESPAVWNSDLKQPNSLHPDHLCYCPITVDSSVIALILPAVPVHPLKSRSFNSILPYASVVLWAWHQDLACTRSHVPPQARCLKVCSPGCALLTGVWPEFSLLNHSCVPNTQPVLIGDRLLLRAASNIPEGGELTTSYLGIGVSGIAEF